MKYDIAIIGLGPAGQKAAKLAKEQGFSVIVFEEKKAGGTCLNVGCVPTKSILHDSIHSNFKDAILRQEDIVGKFRSAIEKDFKNRGIEIINSKAKIELQNNIPIIKANDTSYEANHIIIATGSKPYELKNLAFDHNFIISSDDIFKLEKLPQKITIVGSGAIGIEWARIFHNFGCEVCIIELAEHLLPNMDIDISKRIERIFKTQKIKFYLNTSLDEKTNEKTFKLSTGEELESDLVLVAVGRKKVLPEIIGIENFEIKEDYTTNIQNVYTIGDITNNPMLAHCASYEAQIVINKILKSKEIKLNKNEIPSVVYGTPEIASIGIKEGDIANRDDYQIINMPIRFLPKAWCDNSIEGFIKLIIKDNLIEGAHIVSNEASSLIMQIGIMMKAKMTLDRIKEMVFPHPTYSEGILEAIENADTTKTS